MSVSRSHPHGISLRHIVSTAPHRRRRSGGKPGLQLESLEPRQLLAADIHGFKWEDLNVNGQRDDGEPGLPGVVIYADLNGNGQADADEPQTETMRDDPVTDFDESGMYWLMNVPAGEHTIREVTSGAIQTFPANGEPHVVVVEDGGVVDGIDFGNAFEGSIHGFKFDDVNGNGVRDAGEPGVAGVEIVVTDEAGTTYSTVTGENGEYWIEWLTPGRTYKIEEVLPAGFEQTTPQPPELFIGSGQEWVATGRAGSGHSADGEFPLVAGRSDSTSESTGSAESDARGDDDVAVRSAGEPGSERKPENVRHCGSGDGSCQ